MSLFSGLHAHFVEERVNAVKAALIQLENVAEDAELQACEHLIEHLEARIAKLNKAKADA